MKLFRLSSLPRCRSARVVKGSALAVLCAFTAVCAVNQPEETRAQEGLALAQSELSTVTADNVTLTGNVSASLITVPTAQGEQRALKLVGDKLAARNLALTLPAAMGQGKLTTGDVETTVTDGPVTVLTTGLQTTPAVVDHPTIPVNVDLSNGDLNAVLDQLGVPDPHVVPDAPIPNVLMEHISLQDVTMELVNLQGANLHAPQVQLNVQ